MGHPSVLRRFADIVVLATVVLFVLCLGQAQAQSRGRDLLFLSTQFAHAAEAATLRQTVLKDYPDVVFEPQSGYDALAGTVRNGNPGQPAVIGALHGELASLQAAGLLGRSLLSEAWFGRQPVSPTFADLARLDADGSGYVP